MLFLDRNGDGTVSGVAELSFVDDLPGATSDLAGLRAFDSNGDGALDQADAQFASFGVWRDDNGDGAVGAGETLSLTDAGVAAIGLGGAPVTATVGLGDVIAINEGQFVRADGSSGLLLDAALAYAPTPSLVVLNWSASASFAF